ncbi:LOW QUALITY PROTEIN: hypothetical protein HID58_048268, partial [Brassica napus]
MISYPWLPARCSVCQGWGHKGSDCKADSIKILKRGGEDANNGGLEVVPSVPVEQSARGGSVAIDGNARGRNVVTDLLKELSALPINPFMQNGVRLEMASQEEDVMDSIETSRIQIVEPTTESFSAAGEGNWSLVSGKQPGVSMGSPKFPKDDDVTLLGSPSRFSPLLDLEQEVEDLEKQYEEDTNHVVEEIEEGELVEKKEVQPKTEVAKGRRKIPTLGNKSAKKSIVRAKDLKFVGKQGQQKKSSEAMTSFFAWNMCGFNMPCKHRAVRSWIQSEKPRIGCLVETRVREEKLIKCMDAAMPHWKVLTNYEHHKLGRIWFCWSSEEVMVTKLHMSDQIISCAIQIPETGQEFICSTIYAHNTSAERTQLWRDLRATQAAYSHLHLPWILIGDFNETLSSSVHSHFLHTVKEVWDTSPQLYHSRSALSSFHKKLKLLKFNLRALNRSRFGDLPNRTKQAYEELCECQNRVLVNTSPENCVQESEASDCWQKRAKIEEKFWLQKSCIRWLQAGDQNTVFYHRYVQTRTARNTIRRLITETGEVLTGAVDIKREAVAHFQRFLQSQDATAAEILAMPVPDEDRGDDLVLWKRGED